VNLAGATGHHNPGTNEGAGVTTKHMTDHYERIRLSAPRFVLLDGPTPLQRIVRMQEQLNHPWLFIKRDDHMPLALGGNKVRSLEFWLGQAQAEGADILLVGGGANSNLCRLTAAAAAVAGLDCIVLHNATATEQSRHESFLNRILGAEVRFLGVIDEHTRAQQIQDAAAALREQGRSPYIVGDPVVGALGYMRAAAELLAQAEEARIP
jgi:1-aminocyclopropane-1-carboxylate deaminase/D-cysteine desulfhydrase-like pyridoxal-dependent ACC family enzyme